MRVFDVIHAVRRSRVEPPGRDAFAFRRFDEGMESAQLFAIEVYIFRHCREHARDADGRACMRRAQKRQSALVWYAHPTEAVST